MKPDIEILKQCVSMKMPFGVHKGKIIADLPINYLEWFCKKGFPEGKLGMIMATVFEIKMNGLTEILSKIRNQ